jgi:glycosyltransferase involved in cell wall biosynthesis
MQDCEGLSWSIVVATYNRPDVLKRSIELTLNQTRPPKEVIIVDASECWRETRDQLLGTMSFLGKAAVIKCIYVGAATKSLACQRNQGLEYATGDIVFFFDDDTLMFPDCAEQILEIYEEDDGSLAGLGACSVPYLPNQIAMQNERKVTGSLKARSLFFLPRRVQDFIQRHIILFDSSVLFVPYDGSYYSRALPTALVNKQVHPEVLLVGFSMTFRRSLAEMERFESLLMGYSPGEDLDFSYRISRHGMLASVPRAHVHHYISSSGRTDRYRVAVLSAMNMAMLLRKNAVDLENCKRKFWVLTARKILAELLKDGLSRRWTFPQLRGVLASVMLCRAIFQMSGDELSRRYVQMQINLLQGTVTSAPEVRSAS